MTNHGNRPLVICSIDLESAPDPRAEGLLPASQVPRSSSAALHQIAAAATLVAREEGDGAWVVEALSSLDQPDVDEFGILLGLDDALADVAGRGGEICSWNGLRHDMPLIRRRIARHWAFPLEGLASGLELLHRDMMLATGRHPGEWMKLREACAAAGFTCTPDVPKNQAATAKSPRVRKCEVDATATFLLRLHALALERRDRRPLVEGWSALIRYIEAERPDDAHLRQFRRHAQLEAALRTAQPRK